jgi:hypothetical protein
MTKCVFLVHHVLWSLLILSLQSERAPKRSSRRESHREDRRRPSEKEGYDRTREPDRRRKDRDASETAGLSEKVSDSPFFFPASLIVSTLSACRQAGTRGPLEASASNNSICSTSHVVQRECAIW